MCFFSDVTDRQDGGSDVSAAERSADWTSGAGVGVSAIVISLGGTTGAHIADSDPGEDAVTEALAFRD